MRCCASKAQAPKSTFANQMADVEQTAEAPSSAEGTTATDAHGLLTSWVPEAADLFATFESRLDRIESALKRKAPEPDPNQPTSELESSVDESVDGSLPPLPQWMPGSVVVDGDASATSVWADEGLVLMTTASGPPATREVPETSFAEIPYADEDDFVIIEEPEEFLSAAPYEYKPDFSKWQSAESTLDEAGIAELSTSIPPSNELISALDSNFGLAEDSAWPAPSSEPLLGFLVFGEPLRVDGFLEYSAVDPEDRTGIRLRILDPSLRDERFDADTLNDLLDRERSAALSVHSSAFPRLVEAGERDGVRFLAYETFTGYPLIQARNAWAADEREWCIRRVIRSIAEALAHLHERGLVLADLSPDKIFVTADLECRFSDVSRVQSPNDVPHPLIGEGSLLLAPEILDGEAPGWSADQYMLGQLTYELITGERAISESQEAPAAVPGATPLMEELTLTMLAKDPRDRFSSMFEVARLLTELGPRSRARR